MSKSESLVDCFVFREKFEKAKSAIDKVNKNTITNKGNNLILLKKEVSKNTDSKNTQAKIKEDCNNEQDMNMVRAGHVQGMNMSRHGRDHVQTMFGVDHGHEHDLSTITSSEISLSKYHSIIYLWFIDQGITGVFSKPIIQRALNMPYITVRRAIRKFENTGIIEIHYDKCQKTTEYKINTKIKVKLSQLSMLRSGSEHDMDTIAQESSSSYTNNKTTTNNKADIVNNTLKSDPEFGYWRQKKLTIQQIEKWIKVAGCSHELMLEYLRYCRFEMVNLKLEETKPIENVFNWFFRIIERTGAYQKPKGYKSLQEIQLEREKEVVEQKNKAAKQEQEIYQRKIKAEQDKEFWEMMNDPAGEGYKKCFNSLNDFQKKTKGKIFETSMRGAYDEIV